MSSIVLFGIGSPLTYEYEESCHRLGWNIAFGVRNVDAAVKCSSLVEIRSPDDLSEDERALPFMVPLFTPGNRELAAAEAEKLGFQAPATLVDPTAILASTSHPGRGCFVNAGTVIGAACEIGPYVIVNRNSSIGHHNSLGEFVSIGPGCTTCGNVTIERGALIGAGSVVLPNVTVGANSIIGAGSVIVKDIPANSRFVMMRDAKVTPL